jgi:hypothetical protein
MSSSLSFNNVEIAIYITAILPVLYGCEPWSVTLRVFVSGVLRKVFERDRVVENTT